MPVIHPGAGGRSPLRTAAPAQMHHGSMLQLQGKMLCECGHKVLGVHACESTQVVCPRSSMCVNRGVPVCRNTGVEGCAQAGSSTDLAPGLLGSAPSCHPPLALYS